MRQSPFSRPTLVAAVEQFADAGHNDINRAVLRLALERDVPIDTLLGTSKRADRLGRTVLGRSDQIVDTLDGQMTLGEALVREAIHTLRPDGLGQQASPLERGLARDGFVLETEDGRSVRLRAALPGDIRLADTDDEVRRLLGTFSFTVPLGHLDQAVEAHTRGDWAACNAQLRTFMESLFEAFAFRIKPDEASALQTSENRRELLAREGFLATDRNEWSREQKGYLNGLFKMLHTEGSHPGLSDGDRATFRLHIVIITARTYLRRLTHGR